VSTTTDMLHNNQSNLNAPMDQALIQKLFHLDDSKLKAVVKAYIGNAKLTNAEAICIYMQHVIVNMSQRINVAYKLTKVSFLS